MIKRLLFLTLLLIMGVGASFSQNIENDVISSSGESVSSDTYMITQTIGELFVNSFQSEQGFITEGFNQSGLYYIAAISDQSSLKTSLFPNPAQDRITIASDSFVVDEIMIRDSSGKLIQSYTETTTIDISPLPSGVYLINVINYNQNIKENFKLIKK